MSSHFNNITLMGRLVADPERLTTRAGEKFVTWRMAENWKDRGGQEQSQFHNVKAFNKTAELVAEYLTRGRECIVVGRLQSREAMDKNGNPRTFFDIVAGRVHFVGGRNDGQTAQQDNRQQQGGGWGGNQQQQGGGWGGNQQQ